MCEEKKGSKLIEGIILGGLIGAAAGVLFAPATGEKIRHKIKEKLKDFELEGVIGRLEEAFNEGVKEAEKVMKEDV
ncbi:MAG: YtxH domain-containing protein [Candidatus Margulisiibacteriota bacterium]